MPDPRPTPSGDGHPAPTPGALVRAFRARYGLASETLAAQLGVSPITLEEYDRTSGPGWLRFALAGVAMARGEEATGLRWLLNDDMSDSADIRSGSVRAGDESATRERRVAAEHRGRMADDAPPESRG